MFTRRCAPVMTCLVVACASSLEHAQGSVHDVGAWAAVSKGPLNRHTQHQRDRQSAWLRSGRVSLRGGDAHDGAAGGSGVAGGEGEQPAAAMAESKRLALALLGMAAQQQQQQQQQQQHAEESSAGKTQAFMQLAREYAKGVRMGDQQSQERKGAPDFGRAAEAYRAAADAGSALAMYNLGVLCIEGRGVPRDAVGGAALLSAAAAKNVSAAQYVLGTLHFKGEGVVRDQRKAFLLFSQAAAAGHLDANEALAECYFRGIGIPKNIKMALHFFGEYDRLSSEVAAASPAFETIPLASCGDGEDAGADLAASQGKQREIAAMRVRTNMRACEQEQSRRAKVVTVAEGEGGGGSAGDAVRGDGDIRLGRDANGTDQGLQDDEFGYSSSDEPLEDAAREGGGDVTGTRSYPGVVYENWPVAQQVDCAKLLLEMQQTPWRT